MSVYGLMRTGASGMGAQSDRLSTVADNIANSSTVGYKAATTQFSSLLISTSPLSYASGGVETDVRHEITKQGTLSATSSPYDLAINGAGFMLVADAAGRTALTRSGAFVPDSSGHLVNSAGYNLLGYPLGQSDVTGAVSGTSGLIPVNVKQDSLQAAATTKGELTANLPLGASITAASDLPSANGATSTPTAVSSLVAYGASGEQIVLDVNFAKSSSNNWEIAIYNSADRAPSGAFPYGNAALATANLTFDAQGALTGTNSLTVPLPGGTSFALDLSQTSQLAADYSVLSMKTDGSAPSSVSSIKIDGDGTVYQQYENGYRRATFKIPLATVESPDNLEASSGNIFEPTTSSGDIIVGTAGSSGLGTFSSGSLENSTVDMAAELTEMIEAQRNYTANSKVFQTGAEILETLVNLKR